MPTSVRMSQALAAAAAAAAAATSVPHLGDSKETTTTTGATTRGRVRHCPVHISGQFAYYSGPIDEQGHAHGSGVARFENGELYVGLLDLSSLKRGTLYSKTGQVLCQVR